MIFGEKPESFANLAQSNEINQEEIIQDLSTDVEHFSMKPTLDRIERSIVLGAVHAVNNHLAREGTDVGSVIDHEWALQKVLGEVEWVLIHANVRLLLLEC